MPFAIDERITEVSANPHRQKYHKKLENFRIGDIAVFYMDGHCTFGMVIKVGQGDRVNTPCIRMAVLYGESLWDADTPIGIFHVGYVEHYRDWRKCDTDNDN